MTARGPDVRTIAGELTVAYRAAAASTSVIACAGCGRA
jgi:hypothetical protein